MRIIITCALLTCATAARAQTSDEKYMRSSIKGSPTPWSRWIRDNETLAARSARHNGGAMPVPMDAIDALALFPVGLTHYLSRRFTSAHPRDRADVRVRIPESYPFDLEN